MKKILTALLILSALLALAACQEEPQAEPTEAPAAEVESPMEETAEEPAAEMVASQSGLGDPLYPLLGNAGYDVQHYTIDLEAEPQGNTIAATTTIDAQATQALDSFNLDFAGLEISEITVDGETAEFSRDGQELTVTPATAIADGAAFTTAVTYSGVPEPIVDPGVPFTAIGWLRFLDEDIISVISEPSGAMSWFPNNNHQLDKATYTMRITVPEPYVVAANGELAETVDNGDTTTYVWEMDDLMASYLATVNIGAFERDDTIGPDGILLRNYYPAGRIDEFAPAFEPTAEMIEFFSSILGPYPYDVYGAVVLPVDGDFALETQTLSVFPQSAVDEMTIAHELMHQWLGNSLSPATWQDIWLNEGFSAYFPFLWDEHVNGPEANLLPAMGAYYEFVAGAQVPPPATVGLDNLFAEPIYVRGPLTLHALRLVVGDEVFFDIMGTYYERFAGGTASTADFIDVAAELGGEDARELLNAWLYEAEVPPFPETE
jgi:aminopeptidase N/predicted small lipoprotein YifL